MRHIDLWVIGSGPAEAGAAAFLAGELKNSQIHRIYTSWKTSCVKLAAELQIMKEAFPVMLKHYENLCMQFKHGSDRSEFVGSKLDKTIVLSQWKGM